MDGVRNLLGIVRDQNLAKGRLRGLFHLLIGRSLALTDGTPVCSGLTWRQLAGEMKLARFDKHLVVEVGGDPETLYPRDRERFWYAAIALANVDSPDAISQADQLAKAIKPHGFIVIDESKKKKKG